MRNLVAGFVSVLVLSACATSSIPNNAPRGYKPWSGQQPVSRPDRILPMSPALVQSRLVAGCVDNQMRLTSASETQVICESTMTGAASVLMQFAIGNAYSTMPIAKVRYTLVPDERGTRVIADAWAETQMVGGQVQRMELDRPQDVQALIASIDRLVPQQ